jgi:hypothetical protein
MEWGSVHYGLANRWRAVTLASMRQIRSGLSRYLIHIPLDVLFQRNMLLSKCLNLSTQHADLGPPLLVSWRDKGAHQVT